MPEHIDDSYPDKITRCTGCFEAVWWSETFTTTRDRLCEECYKRYLAEHPEETPKDHENLQDPGAGQC
jgi:hypothetical protein